MLICWVMALQPQNCLAPLGFSLNEGFVCKRGEPLANWVLDLFGRFILLLGGSSDSYITQFSQNQIHKEETAPFGVLDNLLHFYYCVLS